MCLSAYLHITAFRCLNLACPVHAAARRCLPCACSCPCVHVHASLHAAQMCCGNVCQVLFTQGRLGANHVCLHACRNNAERSSPVTGEAMQEAAAVDFLVTERSSKASKKRCVDEGAG
jgi:hypothetical protein